GQRDIINASQIRSAAIEYVSVVENVRAAYFYSGIILGNTVINLRIHRGNGIHRSGNEVRVPLEFILPAISNIKTNIIEEIAVGQADIYFMLGRIKVILESTQIGDKLIPVILD